ncbi:hypothetical protein D3C71_318060 [compost metagenome]
MSENKHPLITPIKAHNEEVSVLTLRNLSPADARAIRSLPYYIAADESIRIDADAGAKYIVKMAGIPLGAVDQLHPADFNKLVWIAAGFFLNADSERTTSSADSSTTLRTSGE